ncbi:MAG: maleylpyruvate isomerase family mycothiol-dependent enzyme [Actinomycetota bacterium]|nr:maleylpyruvate isomerase family mycothiol-dependent enzyme [Actinomycetota bacterium]
MSLDHLSHLAANAAALADAVAVGDPAAPIAGCPGWTLHELAVHVGGVHRWARVAAITAAPPVIDPADDPAPADAAGTAQWLRDGAARLIATLLSLDPAAPTWHPFPIEPKVAGLWPRRQAHETAVHRVDAELALGLPAVLDPAFAADGVDEYWHVMLPRMLTREHRTPPTSRLAVELTDTGHRWIADGSSGGVVVVRGDAPAVVRGTAVDVLLRLWGRPVATDAITIDGDAAVAAEWLALGGS